MKNLFVLLFYTICIAVFTVVSDWLIEKKQDVNVDDIIESFDALSVTGCLVRCKLNDKCKTIGMEKDINFEETGKCFLLGGDVSKSSDNTIEMSVTQAIDSCAKLSPCDPDKYCLDTATPPGYQCACPEGGCQIIAESCRALIKSNSSLSSGMYQINPTQPVYVYCDMERGSGGWMLIANITNTNNLSSEQVAKLTSDDSMATSITDLYMAQNGDFRLDPVYLGDFSTTFTQMLFYCNKPGGRTVHLYTLYLSNNNISIVDYFMLKTEAPNACGSFKKFADDTSILSAACDQWEGGTWGTRSNTSNRLYHYPFSIKSTNLFLLHDKMQCDDVDNGNIGVWYIFVR